MVLRSCETLKPLLPYWDSNGYVQLVEQEVRSEEIETVVFCADVKMCCSENAVRFSRDPPSVSCFERLKKKCQNILTIVIGFQR